MPSFIAKSVIAPIAAALGITLTATVTTFLAYTIFITGTFAYARKKKKDAEKDAIDKFNAAQVDRTSMISSVISPRQLCLGRVRKSGTIIFRETLGQYKEKFVCVIALSGHEIDAIEKFYFNDEEVVINASNGAVITPPYAKTDIYRTGPYNPTTNQLIGGNPLPANALNVKRIDVYDDNNRIGRQLSSYFYQYTLPATDSHAFVRYYLGSENQTADTQLINDFPGLWSSSHIGKSVAYVVLTCFYSDTAFPNGIPNVSCLIRGAKCYDPRTGTTVWTDNPALHMRYVLLHPYFGKRAIITAEEDARIVAAANACDILYNYEASITDPATGQTSTNSNPVKMYRSNLVVDFGASANNVLDDLAQAMGGMWADVGGEFFVRPGIYSVPVKSLSESDLVKYKESQDGSEQSVGHEISVHTPRASKLNQIKPIIWDESNDYKQTTITPLKAATLVDTDGALINQDITFAAVGYKYQALHLAGIILRDLRDSLTFSATFKFNAYPIEMFDVVSITLSEYGWVQKEFIVLGRSVTLPDGVTLRLKEINQAIFQPSSNFVAGGTAKNTEISPPWQVEKPVIQSIQSGNEQLLLQSDGTLDVRAKINIGPIQDQSVLNGGTIEAEYIGGGSALSWNSLSISGDSTSFFISGLTANSDLSVRIRCRTKLAASNWTDVLVHTVVGKTDPPSNPVNFLARITGNGILLSVEQPNDLDWATTEFRSGAWNLADTLTKKKAITHLLTWQTAGLKTFTCKHYDDSGNQSVTEASVNLNIESPSQVIINRTNVQQNSVFIAWNDAKTSQPILSYEYYVGAANSTFEQCVFYGSSGSDGRSDVVNFDSSGNKRIYIIARDLAGNTSQPAFVDCSVTMPANFILQDRYLGVFPGTLTNAQLIDGEIYMPINSTETWSQHFSTRSWTNIQNQISAGFPLYFQPGQTSASYQDTSHDCGKVIGTGTISVLVNSTVLSGSVTVGVQIEYSDNNSTWTSAPAGAEVIAKNFRYVRVKYSVTASGQDDLIKINNVAVTVKSEPKQETVSITLVSTDTNGTVFTTTAGFIDIVGATFTPSVSTINGTTNIARSSIYWDDTLATPLVYVKGFDSSGNRASGSGTLTVSGY